MVNSSLAGAVPEWTIADRLRKAREAAHLEQTELAEMMGVSRGTISNNETGRVAPRLIVVRAWALATGVPVMWLLGEEPSGSGPSPDGAVTAWSRAKTQLTAIGTVTGVTGLPLDRVLADAA